MFIYLDESGDLGFDFSKRGTSRNFIITLLVCDNQAAIKAIKKAFDRTLKNKLKGKSKKDKRGKELKGSSTAIDIKRYFYRQISCQDWRLYAVILDKTSVNPELHKPKNQTRIYKVLSRFVIDKIDFEGISANVRLIVDRTKNSGKIQEFNRYIQDNVEGKLPLNTSFRVEHLKSHEEIGLQVVDLFCWGIARKYARGDLKWYNIFKDKIICEEEYFKSL